MLGQQSSPETILLLHYVQAIVARTLLLGPRGSTCSYSQRPSATEHPELEPGGRRLKIAQIRHGAFQELVQASHTGATPNGQQKTNSTQST
ncbi:MAG: hypothetical protein ACK4VV_14800, partial [Pseudomonas sp.]